VGGQSHGVADVRPPEELAGGLEVGVVASVGVLGGGEGPRVGIFFVFAGEEFFELAQVELHVVSVVTVIGSDINFGLPPQEGTVPLEH
jgi:hypothetical protein